MTPGTRTPLIRLFACYRPVRDVTRNAQMLHPGHYANATTAKSVRTSAMMTTIATSISRSGQGEGSSVHGNVAHLEVDWNARELFVDE